jgi:hypothetical protein
MKKSRLHILWASGRARQFCLTLWLLCLPVASNASLVITFSNDGFGGVIAEFEGSGVTGGVSPNSVAQFFNVGEYTTTSGPHFYLADTITFASGIDFVFLGISDDLAPNPDDFGFSMNGLVSPGTAFSTTGSSAVIGLSYSDLIPGVYTSSTLGGIKIEDFSLVVAAVPIPPALWLFGSGLLGLVGIARRKKA